MLADVLPGLPAPQRRALEVALLLEDARGSRRRITARSPSHSLARSGRSHAKDRVVVAVDDIQWLDRPSAFMVEFAIRRLRDEPVVFLLTLRTGEGPAPLGLERALAEGGLRRLTIGPLSLGVLHRLLSERLDLVLSRPKLRRLRELSGGNPLFALELGRAVQPRGDPVGAGRAPARHARGGRSRSAHAASGETRTALLTASALSQPTLALVAAAVGGDPETRLAPALEAHVIELDDDRIRFTHPLLASAVYSEAGAPSAGHSIAGLAELVPDLEERARHLALGADGPDEEVAAALEQAPRGAHAAAVPSRPRQSWPSSPDG